MPLRQRAWPWFLAGIACAQLGFDLFYRRELWEGVALVMAVPLVLAGSSPRFGPGPRRAVTMWALGAVAFPLVWSAVAPFHVVLSPAFWSATTAPFVPWFELFSVGAGVAGALGVAAIVGVWRGRTWGLVALLGAHGVIAFTPTPALVHGGTCFPWVHPLYEFRGIVLALLALAVCPWLVPMARAVGQPHSGSSSMPRPSARRL